MSYPTGKRRNPMTAYKNVPTTDANTGEQLENGVPLCEFWGAILTADAAAREGWTSWRMVANLSHVIRAPYIAGIDTRSWITFGSRRFNMAGPPVDPDERQAEHILLVMEAGE